MFKNGTKILEDSIFLSKVKGNVKTLNFLANPLNFKAGKRPMAIISENLTKLSFHLLPASPDIFVTCLYYFQLTLRPTSGAESVRHPCLDHCHLPHFPHSKVGSLLFRLYTCVYRLYTSHKMQLCSVL